MSQLFAWGGQSIGVWGRIHKVKPFWAKYVVNFEMLESGVQWEEQSSEEEVTENTVESWGIRGVQG